MQVDTGRWKTLSAAGSRPEAPECESGVASPGRLIARERVRQGLSLDHLSTLTKIPRAQLEALENDRFDQLAGPVFVKGFFRCCARALRIEEDLVFGMLYEQERESIRNRRRSMLAADDRGWQGVQPSGFRAEANANPLVESAEPISAQLSTNRAAAPHIAAARSQTSGVRPAVDLAPSPTLSGLQPAWATSPAASSSSLRAPKLSVGAREVVGGIQAAARESTRASTWSDTLVPWSDRAPVASAQAAARTEKPWSLGRMLEHMPGQDSLAEIAEIGRSFFSRAFPARLAMWAAVSLLVAAIVFIAFNLASAHHTVELMRS